MTISMHAVSRDTSEDAERHLDRYVPRVLLRHLAEDPHARVRSVDATVLFADISGFTALSERLARQGRQGAEELTETIGGPLTTLLSVAYENGGSLLKLGGDALLLLFEHQGHAARACRAALGMRSTLREVGRLQTNVGRVTLRVSQGVHTGTFHNFLVGNSHREHLLVGPAASTVVRMEGGAAAGEVLISAETAVELDPRCVGAPKGPGFLLAGEPAADAPIAEPPYEPPSLTDVAECIPVMVRAQVISGRPPSEHRNVTAAFLKFAGTDEIIESEGPQAAAEALEELVGDVQRAVDGHEACFLQSDVDRGGGKILLTAGAPRIVGDDEERMLLALREIVEADRRLPVQIGVNRGNVFAGVIGPRYRQTYTIMGDAVNLAARVMAEAPAGKLYSTAGALERSPTHFRTVRLSSFEAKGKSEPVQAWSVGPPISSRSRAAVAVRFPLVGRRREMRALTAAVEDARGGHGRFVEIVGEPGLGKTRLAEELRERAAESDFVCLETLAELMTVSTPYFTWRDLLREALDVGWEDTDEIVLGRLRECVDERAPELEPWLPLLALPFDLDPPRTPEVDAIPAEFRRGRLHQTVIAFLRVLLDRPTLLVFDDAQHLDEASADLLGAVAREIGSTPWLVAVVGREGGRFAAPAAPDVVRLEPGPLPATDTTALAEAATDASPLNPALLKLAVERSGGNPQFLRDLLRAAGEGNADELPESLEAAAMARIDRLDPGDRMIIRRASVLGQSFHPRFLTEVLDEDAPLPKEETWLRLEPFFLDDGDGYLRFRRAIVQEAAYAALPYRARRRMHAAVGRRMEREFASSTHEVGGMLSLHFHLAAEHEKAWHYAREAARRARDRSAFSAAAELYRRALDSARRVEVAPDDLASVWEELGEAQNLTGETAAAVQAFTRARKLLPEDPVGAARLIHRTAWMHLRTASTTAAVRWALRGVRDLEGLSGPDAARERAALLTTLASARHSQGRLNECEPLYRRAMEEAGFAGDEIAFARAASGLDSSLFLLDRAQEATHSQRALDIYVRAGDLEGQGTVLNNLGMSSYWEGRWKEAIDLYARAAEASERGGNLWGAAYGDCNIGEVLADQGHLELAEERLRRARRVWSGTEDEQGVAFTTALLGRLAARTGREEEARELLADAAETLHRLMVPGDAALAEAYLAEAELLAGRAREALAAAEGQLADPAAPRTLLLRVRGCALTLLDQKKAAESALAEALAEAREGNEAYEVAVSLDALIALGAAPPAAERERDEILATLGVVALPAPLDDGAPDDSERSRSGLEPTTR